MRNILPLILLLTGFFVSCVDKDYDLSKVDTDDITIGSEGSEFRIPLLTLKIDLTKMTQGTTSIEELFKEANLWLPQPLPGNAEFVDLNRLFRSEGDDHSYREELISLFFSQLKTSPEKLENLTSAIFNTPKYLQGILEVIPSLPAQPSFDQFETAFHMLVNNQDMLVMDKVNEFVYDYLTQQLRVDDVVFKVDGGIKLDESITDLLSKNLDKPNNSLCLYGNISSLLPVSIALQGAKLEPTNISLAEITIESEGEGQISEANVSRSDLDKITKGLTIRLPVGLTKYYPNKEFDLARKDQLTLELKLVKYGPLSFNL